jgi:hypothetical protein
VQLRGGREPPSAAKTPGLIDFADRRHPRHVAAGVEILILNGA